MGPLTSWEIPALPVGAALGWVRGGGTGCSDSSPILRDSRGHTGQTHVALPAALFPVPCGEDTAVLMEAPPLPKLFSCICVTGICELQPSRGWH